MVGIIITQDITLARCPTKSRHINAVPNCGIFYAKLAILEKQSASVLRVLIA